MSLKRVFGLCLVMAAGIPLFSAEVALTDRGIRGGRFSLTEWRYQSGDNLAYAAMDYDDSSWETVAVPLSIPLAAGYGWLRIDLEVKPSDFDLPLYVLLGRLDSAAEVYLNGSLIGSRGTFEPFYSTPSNKPEEILVPPGLWRPNGRNILALRLRAPASFLPIQGLEMGDTLAKQYEQRLVTLFNFDLYSVLGFLCAFIGMYFLILWVSRRQDTPNLWYAVSSLAIAFYFIEIGSTFPILHYSLNRALAKMCLVASMASLVAFFIDYLKLKRPRVLVILLAAIPAVTAVGYLIARGDNAQVNRVFNWSLIFVQAAILFIVIATVRAVVRGNRAAIPLLVGVVIGVGFGTHDVVYSALNLKPFAWLQGLGFFAMNISLFVALTLRSSRLYKELEEYSKAIEEKTQQLSLYINRIEETANSVSAISEEIDSDAGLAALSASKLASEAERIGLNADKQAQAAADSEAAVHRLGQSLGLVRAGVDAQATGVEEAAESVAVVANAVAMVSENLESTANFARGLDGTAQRGRQASKVLDDAIAKIKDTAGEVSTVVDAVEDFAERTNLLAMNAAIEAAHAGAAGRGFAVIANEIKGLAAASAERASRIRESISEITNRIGKGVDANAGVVASLDSVAENARIALESIVSVGSSLNDQRKATDRLSASLKSLADSAESIRSEAESQESDGQRIRARMTELVSISNDLRSAIAGIAQENAAIAETTRRLASVSRDGQNAVAGLRLMLESRKEGR